MKKDEPDPNGGVSSAELFLALGKTIDEALDMHNELEKIAKGETKKSSEGSERSGTT